MSDEHGGGSEAMTRPDSIPENHPADAPGLQSSTLTIALSDDPDDAFMSWGLVAPRVASEHRYRVHFQELATLNQDAVTSRFDISALSVAAYGHVADRYAILPVGAAIGRGAGPLLVSSAQSIDELHGAAVAVPGALTTAAFVARLAVPGITTVAVPFARLAAELEAGRFRAGVLIHEGPLLHREGPLRVLLDLGAWWRHQTGLPLPLGVNVIRRDLDRVVQEAAIRDLRASIAAALAEPELALDYAARFARGMDRDTLTRFVFSIVDERSLDLAEDDRQGIELFLRRAATAGLLPASPDVRIAPVDA